MQIAIHRDYRGMRAGTIVDVAAGLGAELIRRGFASEHSDHEDNDPPPARSRGKRPKRRATKGPTENR